MAESSDGQEKTEEPTGKRISDARKKGQLPRSREAGTFFVLLSGVASIWLVSPFLGEGMTTLMKHSFTLTKSQAFDTYEMGRVFLQDIVLVAIPLLAICFSMLVAAFIGNIMIGGMNFSTEAMMPKPDKLNPINGFKRIFSMNSIVELIKSIAKVACIGSICYFLISGRINEILRLSYIDVFAAVRDAMNILFIFMVIIVSAMIPIIMIDVPFQYWQYRQQLRMTKQELKDEMKETEGNPQIKSRMKRMQYEMAARRMMSKVPTADVVVTNPTHYAVALSYDPNGELAPVVVAKGVDEVAEKIKEIAREYKIPVMQLPPLARSLYYTTDLDREIPRGLFQAVAQVLAWVMGTKAYNEGKAPNRPRDLDKDLPIPDELKF
ncbi:MAG: flagellar biosynthesis protein FlhB [Anaerobiospirillum succiniciproducens]|uniref:flagellar biosynthesis protein FlhB n=1 Tax=Anaerobiospirillum succiniciproducens TaxID=13335 RepID=UPI002A7597F3|nr:flagellar biosynthesis protein FlhB [Anaerobiospirillum succiniciproducens]MDY2798506.1 flagellar biosynthesis protein FlhB [Anaerobiospirillum succiniciproducens]